MNDVHVIFGTGPLGRAVMQALVERGKPVRMVNRSGVANVPDSVEVVRGNGYSVESAREVSIGAEVVYQCAQPPYHQWTKKFPALQAAILEGAAANGAKLILAENLYMYGEVAGKIHEELPYQAQTRKGKVRAQMAQAALNAHRAGKVRVAIGRGSDFFGPGVLNSAIGARAFYPALQGKTAQLFGNVDIPHTFTFIEDFGRALVLLGERDEALGEVWHVPNDSPTITQRQLIAYCFEEIGAPPKIQSVGRGMMRLVGFFNAGAREMIEMMYQFEQPFVVESRKFENTFQLHATPIRQAVQKTVAWFRAHPQKKH